MRPILYEDPKVICSLHAIYRMNISVLSPYSVARITGFSLDGPGLYSCIFYEQMCQHEEFPTCILAKRVSWLAGYLMVKKFFGTISGTYLTTYLPVTPSIHPTSIPTIHPYNHSTSIPTIPPYIHPYIQPYIHPYIHPTLSNTIQRYPTLSNTIQHYLTLSSLIHPTSFHPSPPPPNPLQLHSRLHPALEVPLQILQQLPRMLIRS